MTRYLYVLVRKAICSVAMYIVELHRKCYGLAVLRLVLIFTFLPPSHSHSCTCGIEFSLLMESGIISADLIFFSIRKVNSQVDGLREEESSR